MMSGALLPAAVQEGLGSVWQLFGVEIMIFFCTATFIVLARKASGQQGPWSPRSAIHTASSVKKLAVATEGVLCEREARKQRHSHVSTRVASSRRDGSLTALDQVNSIMSLMKGPSSQRAACEALKIYAQLRQKLIWTPAKAEEGGRADGEAGAEADRVLASIGSALLGEVYTTLVQCAVRGGQCHLVEQLLDDMKTLDLGRTVAFYESAMKQLAGQKKHREALAVYDRLVADGFKPSIATASCLVSFANEIGDDARATAFFHELAKLTTPSIRAYMTMLRVKSRQQDFPGSVKLLCHMRERGVPCDSLVLNVVLATGVAAGQQEAAASLLAQIDDASPNGPVSDVVSYNTVLKGHAHAGNGHAALEAIVRMKARGLSPNAISFNTAMDAYVRSGQPNEAWLLLKEMRASGLPPDRFTCSILVKGVSKNPQTASVSAALALLDEVRCERALTSSLYSLLIDRVDTLSDASIDEIVSRAQQQKVQFTEPAQKRLQSLLTKRASFASSSAAP